MILNILVQHTLNCLLITCKLHLLKAQQTETEEEEKEAVYAAAGGIFIYLRVKAFVYFCTSLSDHLRVHAVTRPLRQSPSRSGSARHITFMAARRAGIPPMRR